MGAERELIDQRDRERGAEQVTSEQRAGAQWAR